MIAVPDTKSNPTRAPADRFLTATFRMFYERFVKNVRPDMSETSRSVTNPGAFKERSLGKQVGLAIVTLGFYMLYWWHITHKQLNDGTDADFNPTMRTIGLFIPIYNFLVVWKTSNDAEAVQGQSGTILFILFLFFAPAAWYFVQSGINDIASGE